MNKIDPFTTLIFLVFHIVACIAISSSFLTHFAESKGGGVLWDIILLQMNITYVILRLRDLGKVEEELERRKKAILNK